MNELIKVFLSLSLSGTLLILAVFLCNTLFKSKLSRQWQYYIWLIVVVRLLIPFTTETNLVGNIFQRIDNVSIQTENSPQYEQNSSVLPETDLTQDYEPADGNTGLREAEQQPRSEIQPEKPETQPKQNMLDMMLQYVWVVWLIGAIALLIRKITIYQSFVKYIKAGRVEISDIAVWERFGKLVEQSGVKRTVGIYTNSMISSPLLIGFFRPCIMLPTTELSDSDFQYTILHELTHYKRMDMFYRWLVQITICLHWFNPFVYLMGREINRACELSCDEAVIQKLDTNSQRAYGDTLLNALGIGGNYKDSFASVTLTESKELLKERLDAIMKFKKKTKVIACISIALAFMLLCGAAYAGAYTGVDNTVANNNASNINTRRAPDNIQIDTARADKFTTIERPNLEITIDTDVAVDFVPTSDKEITVDYGSTLYDVSIENEKGNWRVHISYIGSYSMYPAAVLHIPDIAFGDVNLQIKDATVYFSRVFQNVRNINATMEDCSVFYTIPTDFTGILTANAPDCYFELHSDDGFKNCNVTVANCDTFGDIADGFTKRGDSFIYSNGTQAGVINVDLNGGYASIETGTRDGAKEVLGTSKDTSAVQPQQIVDNRLTLIEKEYTLTDLQALNISGLVVEALSENVSITRGGKTLKIQYYVLGQNDYTLQKEFDGGGTRENLCLLRKTPLGTDEAIRSITITIPDEANLKVIQAITSTGNITLENCISNLYMGVITQSGQVLINGGSATGSFKVLTDSGNALITGISSGDGSNNVHLETQTGTISFQPKDSAQNYSLVLDTGADAQITVNGKKYAGGDYETNDGASKRIYFDSPNGALIVQDLSMGKLSLASPTPQSSSAVPTAQPKPAVNSNLTQVKKEYTASDLQSMNITGLRINALADDVVLTQGGTSLILEYSQAYGDEYSLQTKEYQLYMDGYGPASQGNLPGTIEQLVLSRTSEAASSEARRTIYITLPADLKLNRVVKIITDSGNITADKCSSTAMFDLITKSGNIKATQCNSPFIGAESKSGKIELSSCKMDELGMMTVSGDVTLQLADKAVNYKMTIDTGAESQITVNGKNYQGGEFTLNKNAVNIIQFDSKNGSLVVNDN